MSIATPCCTRRLAIVVMSARSGRLARISVSSVNRLAAISGSAAFLAPPILIVPDSGTPPRIRILSIVSAPGGDDRRVRRRSRRTRGAIPRAILDCSGCFYGRARGRSRGRSGRWLVARHHLVRRVAGAGLAGASLLLAAPHILAQRSREA